MIFILLFFLQSIEICAEVRLPAIIASHMVLPQNTEINIWGWADPREIIKVTVKWDTTNYTCVTDFRSAKWEMKVKTPKAGGPYKIIINASNEIVLNDVMIGEVWLCGGQSNMELSAASGVKQAIDEAPNATNKNIRFFYVSKTAAEYPQDDTKGKWVVCNPDDMKKFSAVGYFFGKRLQEKLQQPIGLINANWGGTGVEVWASQALINNNSSFKEAAQKTALTNDCCPIKIASLFNGMISPIIPYKISGVIWYQGETNRFSYAVYPSLLKAMVEEWRKLWQYDFPFYFVQIAPYSDSGTKNYVALMREAQTKCVSIPQSGMVVISDLVDDINNVHPQNKLDVGIRLANYALAKTYGQKGFQYKSPEYRSMKVENDKIRIWFDNAEGGLISKDGLPTEFYIAGNDKNFIPAVAKIDGSSIVVYNTKQKKPVAVRFGFSNGATPNLFSKEGLPVNLFRTDEWPIQTEATVKNTNRPIVGAIRWDAWIGDIGQGLADASAVGHQVERSLSPHKYHYRAPFYSTEISHDSIQCRGTTQEIMDQEIAYAKDAGLDYWAFCWYPSHSGLDTARQLYLASKNKNDIKWCVILGTNPFDYNTDAVWLVESFKENNYQKVLNGRPLIYVFPSTATSPERLNRLRRLTKEAGIADPYITIMEFSAKNAIAFADSLHADALSAYISWAGKNGEPYYPVIPKADSTGWENYKATGKKVIPWVTTGHNTRPRIDHPVTWTKVPADEWVSDGTPQQIAANLDNALQWVNNNKQTAEANAILMYSWNEFDEGGWLCPTLNNNTSRLDAVKEVFRKK
ncbi:MAG: sialate O-acetylesterase [Ginsengibacter sp.]